MGAPQGPEGGPESTIFEIGKISTKIMKMHGKCMKIHEKCMILYFDFNYWVRFDWGVGRYSMEAGESKAFLHCRAMEKAGPIRSPL